LHNFQDPLLCIISGLKNRWHWRQSASRFRPFITTLLLTVGNYGLQQ